MENTFGTQNDYRSVIIYIMDFLKPYCSKGKTRIFINNYKNDDVIASEDFSRILWAAAPFIKGGGHNINIEDLYRFGTINGTNPSSNEYWGTCNDFDNKFKVMAPIACGLLINSDIIFSLYNQNERQNIVKWLYNINLCKCGGYEEEFFIILVNSALKLLGRPYDNEKLENAFKAVENMYLGKGWYGSRGVRNYKITLSIQFYSLIYAKTMLGYDEKRCKTYIKRAEELLTELYKNNCFVHNIDNIALLSFCSACIYADVNVMNLNILNIINTMKRAMVKYSRLVMDIFKSYLNDRDRFICRSNTSDFLTWYMKVFLVLALPEEHRFWRVS